MTDFNGKVSLSYSGFSVSRKFLRLAFLNHNFVINSAYIDYILHVYDFTYSRLSFRYGLYSSTYSGVAYFFVIAKLMS